MKGLTREEVQELVDLTIEQKKAWLAFEKAVKKCKKEKIFFYQVLETIGALNGYNVKDVRCYDDKGISGVPSHMFDSGTRCLNGPIDYDSVYVVGSFADDDHYIQLNTD